SYRVVVPHVFATVRPTGVRRQRIAFTLAGAACCWPWCTAGPRVERFSIQYLERIRRGQLIVVMRHANIAMARRGGTSTYTINGPTRTTEVRVAIILDSVVRHQRATISGYGATAADCQRVTRRSKSQHTYVFRVLDLDNSLSADVDS